MYNSELECVADDSYPGQVIEPLPRVEIEGEGEWEVEEVLDSKIQYRKLQYVTAWSVPDLGVGSG